MRKAISRGGSVFLRAFTLIEILVVVAIIAMLIAILLPSLAAARRMARTVACRSNEHQMGMGLTMYTNQYGYFPGHHLGSATPKEHILWPVRLMRMMRGAGGRGTGQYQIYWCPDSRYKKRWDGRQRLVSSATPDPTIAPISITATTTGASTRPSPLPARLTWVSGAT